MACRRRSYRNGSRPSSITYDMQCRFGGKFWARMPQGESRFDVAKRIHQAFGTFHRDALEHGIQELVVICHGVTLRAFVMMWCHLSPEWFETEPNPANCRDPRHRWRDRSRLPVRRLPETVERRYGVRALSGRDRTRRGKWCPSAKPRTTPGCAATPRDIMWVVMSGGAVLGTSGWCCRCSASTGSWRCRPRSRGGARLGRQRFGHRRRRRQFLAGASLPRAYLPAPK